MIVHLEPKIPPNCVLIGSQSLTLHTTCMERWGDCLLKSWGSIYVLRLESSVCTSLLNIQWSCNDEQWSKNVRVRDGDHNLNRNMYSVPSWLHIGLQASSCNSTPERRQVVDLTFATELPRVYSSKILKLSAVPDRSLCSDLQWYILVDSRVWHFSS